MARASWWKVFFGRPTDFIVLLREQLQLTRQAVQHLRRWSQGDPAALDDAVEIETRSDAHHRQLVEALAMAFETPLDREDIHDLSRRLDDIVDAVRHGARKIHALEARPEALLERMLANVGSGLAELDHAIGALPDQTEKAREHADRARHSQRQTEELESEALSQLIEGEDVKHYLRQREIYALAFTIGHMLEATGEGLVHAINKLG